MEENVGRKRKTTQWQNVFFLSHLQSPRGHTTPILRRENGNVLLLEAVGCRHVPPSIPWGITQSIYYFFPTLFFPKRTFVVITETRRELRAHPTTIKTHDGNGNDWKKPNWKTIFFANFQLFFRKIKKNLDASKKRQKIVKNKKNARVVCMWIFWFSLPLHIGASCIQLEKNAAEKTGFWCPSPNGRPLLVFMANACARFFRIFGQFARGFSVWRLAPFMIC